MHERERRDAERILEVAVVLADLVGEEQALVDDGARRHRRLVELLAVFETERANRVRGTAADDVELALERVGDHHVDAAADEDLAHDRLARAHRRRHRHLPVDRDVAPAENDLPFATHRALDFLLAGEARGKFLRQEDHADAVVAGARQLHSLFFHFAAQESVGNLDQDAGTVTHQRIGADRAPVIQVFQDLQTLLDNVVTLLPLDVRNEADAAGVVFVGRVVQALPFNSIHHIPSLRRVHNYRSTRA